MDAVKVRTCLNKLLSREEPGLLVPQGCWNPELQQEIERLDPGKDTAAHAVKSVLLLWNDDLEGCHAIAQDLPDEVGGYAHGIMHRREPDYGNAKYWFRKIGDHPLFPQIRAAALELLGDATGLDSYRRALGSVEKWDGFRMVDWCEAADEEPQVSFLRALQAIEIQGLTFYWLEKAGISRP